MNTETILLGGNVGNVVIPKGFAEIARKIKSYNDTLSSRESWRGGKDDFERGMFEHCHAHAVSEHAEICKLLKAAPPEFTEFASGVIFWFNPKNKP